MTEVSAYRATRAVGEPGEGAVGCRRGTDGRVFRCELPLAVRASGRPRRVVGPGCTVSAQLAADVLFAGRFLVERLAGRGGMGTVYRARDIQTGQLVALKLLAEHVRHGRPEARLGREAALLATLRHDGIVGYIAHGQSADEPAYLVMEWVEGAELAELLAHGPLSIAESIGLLRSLASALAAAHRRGVVHRDLKPSNIRLRDGRLAQPVLLDFGIARSATNSLALTATGALLGTPAYMSPEQVRGDRDVGPAADVFALGCIVHECLTGASPFAGDSIVAILGAILLGEPPSLQDLVPALPAPLAALLARLLSKEAAARPADAHALLAELDALGPLELPERTAAPRTGRPDAAPASAERSRLVEQRLVSVVLAAAPGARPLEGALADGQADVATLAAGTDVGDVRAALRDLAVQAEWLRDGLLVATVAGAPSALDQAALAARAALVLRGLWPEARVAVTTGRATVLFDRPLGDAVDRAARLLDLGPSTGLFPAAGPLEGGRIALDELSADLLSSRYEIERHADRPWLCHERASPDEERLLLGRPVPCVGREQELGILEALLAGCVDEGVARAALVTAPPGTGKSRVRREFVRRLAARQPDAIVSGAAGELLGAGAPYGLLAQVIRRLASVHPGEPPEHQRAGLAARVAETLPEGDRERVVDFLAELCRVPSAEPSPRLRVARSEPKVMTDQVLRAVTDLLRAECARQPVVLVLEDLQWADAPSVHVLDALPRALSDAPLLLVAFARPELHDLFPRLWSGTARTEIALGGLSRAAAERLVRAVRGAQVSRETVARIVAQADGNALFLEELLRADAEGRGESPPESVLAMVQARLSRLAPELRRLLRAASVFGETFWLGPLAALLGRARDSAELSAALRWLVETEIIERRPESRLPSEEELCFRHDLVREAVYALVLEEDRALWHRQAALLLARLGERDPLVLAAHHERGGALEAACAYLLEASEAAIAANDLSGALDLVARALATGPEGAPRGRLLGIRARALTWSLRWKEGHEAACEALALLPAATAPWFSAVWYALLLGGVLGEDATLERVGPQFLSATPPRDAHLVYVQTAASVVSVYALRGQRARASAFLAKLDAIAPVLEPNDLQSRAWSNVGQNDYRRAFDVDPWQQERTAAEAARLMAEAENERDAVFFAIFHGQALGELGALAEGEALLRETLRRCAHRAERYLDTNCRLHLAELLLAAARPGAEDARLDEIAELAASVLATENVSEGFRRWALRLSAEIAVHRGDLRAAEALAREASRPGPAELRRLRALAVLLRVLVLQGALDEAGVLVAEALAWLAERGGAGYAEVPLRLAVAEALEARGAGEAARDELGRAGALVEGYAARIPEPGTRERFLAASPVSVQWRRCAASLAPEAPPGSTFR